MDETGGGWLWVVVDVVFVAALGAVILYGYLRWRKNRKTPEDRVREEEAIKHLYGEDTR